MTTTQCSYGSRFLCCPRGVFRTESDRETTPRTRPPSATNSSPCGLLTAIALALAAAACTVDTPHFGVVDGGPVDGGGDDDDDDDDGGSNPDSGVPLILLVVDPTTLEVSESAQSSFNVSLGSAPAGTFEVEMSSSDEARLSVTPATLQFTADDWNDLKPVVVTALEDDDVEPIALKVEVSALGAVDNVSVTVNVADNDTLALTLSPDDELDVSEGGTGVISVQLTAEPSAPIELTVSSGSSSTATVPTTPLTFTAANWDQAQEVTVTGVEDVDTTSDTTTIDFDGGGSGLAGQVSVRVVDNDVLGIAPSTTGLGTILEGASTTFTVALTQQPSASVVVAVGISDDDAIDTTEGTLTFTTGNWDVAQTVHVSALPDADTDDQDNVTISLSVPADSNIVERQVTVTVADDDTQEILASPPSLALDENQQGSFSVSLRYQPSASVTVNVGTLNASVATTPTSSLTFLPGNYDTPQSVSVTAQDDPDLVDSSTAIRLQSSGLGLTTEVPVDVNDLDTQTIQTSVATVSLGEATTGSFGVRLGAQPAGSVSLTVTSGSATKATVPSTPLSFNAGNWNDYQNVVVTGVQDQDLANESVIITISGGGAPNKTVTATVNDDDTQQILVSQATLSVTEGTSSNVVTVSLAFQPPGNVSVAVTPGSTLIATASPNPVSFSTADWNTAKPITITGVQDDNVIQDQTMIAFTASGAMSGTLTVTVPDNDTLAFVVNPTSQAINENSTGTFTVRLSNIPTAAVSATLTPVTSGIYGLSTTSLNFNSGNWSTPVTVTVTPTADSDDVTETSVMRVTAAGVTDGVDTITITDTTMVIPLGAPTYLGSNGDLPSGDIYAYRVTTPTGAAVTLDRFGMVSGVAGAPTALGKMALYSDNGLTPPGPGTLVASTGAFSAPVSGQNTVDITDVALAAGTSYWIAITTAPATPPASTMNLGGSTTTLAVQCTRGFPNFNNGFPVNFGVANCANDSLYNLFIVTYR